MTDPIRPATAERVLERLGFSAPPPPTLDGLNALYRAWGRSVSFDNVRKLVALASGSRGPLPGARAEEFLEAWLRHGTGGTCWPSSNGLFALVAHCGFDARRISGAMQNADWPNHGSVVARIEGTDYLVDSSMLTDVALPLRPGEAFEREDPLHPIRVEPLAGSFRIHWSVHAAREPSFVCRLLDDPVDHAFYLERYEITRAAGKSPFNTALFASRNTPDAVFGYMGRSRFRKTAAEVEKRELGRDALARSLVEELGLSEEIVSELAKHGALDEEPTPASGT